MNFFDHQDAARRATRRLVVLFICTVLGVVAMLYAPWGLAASQERGSDHGPWSWWDTQAFLTIAGTTVVLILLGAGVKRVQLAGGGKSVAESLGGAWLNPAAASPAERRLLDVVEEMAIASGMPVPPVYVLEDESINAFAAGNTPQDAVLGFTRGAVAHLTRDELQGVVAHEFSHVAHGDMRLNIRLACAVAGIMVIALVGRALFHIAARLPRAGKGGAGAALGVFSLGLLLLVAGSVGAFFGRILQAAVSRQREFLADASAAQYTRAPAALASALRRIAGIGGANRLENVAASGLNHFFFTSAASTWLATHPPIEERIRRLESSESAGMSGAMPPPVPATGPSAAPAPTAPAPVGAFLSGGRPATGVTASVTPTSHALALLHRRLPPPVLTASQQPLDAQALLLLTTWSDDASVQAMQREIVRARLGVPVLHAVQSLRPSMVLLRSTLRLVVVDLCMPALQQLSLPQYRTFREALGECMRADGRIELFEWTLRSVLARRVEGRFGALRDPMGSATLASLDSECRLLLSALAWAGDPARAAAAYARGAQQAGLPAAGPLDRSICSLDAVDAALERLAHLAREGRRQVVDASAAVVCEDGQIHPRELLLLRGVGDRLDVLVPSPIDMLVEDATGDELGG